MNVVRQADALRTIGERRTVGLVEFTPCRRDRVGTNSSAAKCEHPGPRMDEKCEQQPDAKHDLRGHKGEES